MNIYKNAFCSRMLKRGWRGHTWPHNTCGYNYQPSFNIFLRFGSRIVEPSVVNSNNKKRQIQATVNQKKRMKIKRQIHHVILEGKNNHIHFRIISLRIVSCLTLVVSVNRVRRGDKESQLCKIDYFRVRDGLKTEYYPVRPFL